MRYFRQIALAAICSVALFDGQALAANTAQTITIATAPSNITWPSTVSAGSPSAPAYSVTSATSGLFALEYTTTSSACSVTLGGAITITDTGSCLIKVDQPGGGSGGTTYDAAAQKSFTFTINKADQTIEPAGFTQVTFGSTVPALASTSSAELAVNYSSTTTGVCTISSDGSVTTLLTLGVCSIKAVQNGDSHFNAAPTVTNTFTVKKATPLLAFPAPADTPINATPPTLTASSSNTTTPVTYASTTASICTVTPSGVVTLSAVGICKITASQASSGNFNAALSVSASFSVTPAVNTISFAPLTATALSGTAPLLTASATSGAVVFISKNTTTCDVASSTITLKALGTCSITASADATGNYAAATPVTQTFQITANAQAITFPPPADTPLTSPAPTLSASASSLLAPTYTSKTPTDCTVTPAGAITLKAAGPCTITASQAGDKVTFAAAPPIDKTFTILKGVNTISPWSFTPTSVALGSPPPKGSTTASSKLPVTYKLTAPEPSPAVCSVNLTSGAITILSTGTCSITASQAGNANYLAAADVPASFTVTGPAGSTLTFVQPNVALSATPLTLGATSTKIPPVISYISKTTGVCTVPVSGASATLIKVGVCTITASDGTSSVTRSFAITSAGSNVITFALPPNTPFSSAPPALAATATTGLPVSFASTTKPVCDFVGGALKFISGGSCSITASQAGAAPIPPAKSVTRVFTVTPGANVITFTATPTNTLYTDTPPAISATATSGLPVSFASNTSSICTVTKTGAGPYKIAFVSGGTCSITASEPGSSTAADPGNTSWATAAKVTVTFEVLIGNNVITFLQPDGIALTTPNPPTGTLFTAPPPALTVSASSKLRVDLTSDTTNVCTVTSPGGVIKFITGGTCSITATQPGDATYQAATPVQRSFEVLPGVNVITFPALASVTLNGVPTQPSATASSGLKVSYTTQTPDLCAVDANTGTITLLQDTAVTLPSDCTITASQGGSVSYVAAADVNKTFSVNPNPTATGGGQQAAPPAFSAKSFSPPAAAAAAPAAVVNPTSTELSTTNPSPLLGQSITLKATVTPPPEPKSGTVTFFDGLTTICDAIPLDSITKNTATCTLIYSTGGPHIMTATFNGNNAFSPSTSVPLTIDARDQRPWTLATIAQFLGLRSDMIAANGPDQSREVDRLNEADDAAHPNKVASSGDWSATSNTAEAGSADDGWKPSTAVGFSRGAGLGRNPYTAVAPFGGLGLDATPVDVSPLARLLHLQGTTDGQTQFSFATSLRDLTRFSADADARKASEAGLAFTDRPAGSHPARPNPFDVWVEGKMTTYRDTGFDGNQDGRFSLVSVGADYVLSPNVLIGLMGQFDSMDQLKTGPGTHTSGSGWMIGPYATLRLTDSLFLQTRGAWGKSSNQVSPYLTYTDNFETDRWLLAATLHGRMGYGNWSVRPTASFSYMVEDAKSYADHFGVTIPELKSRLGQAKIGPDIGYSFHLGDSAIVEPHVSLQMIWDFANDATAAGYSTITPDPAASAGGRGKADFGLHVIGASGMVIDATGSYDGIGSKGYQAITGGAKVSVPLN